MNEPCTELSRSIRTVAELMAISARTAPKAVDKDFIVTEITEGDDLQRLAEKRNLTATTEV